jgi:hypothetical protein
MRYLNLSVNRSDLIDGFNLGTESTMNTEDFTVYDCSDREIVKDFGTIFPRIRIPIFSINFIIKSINSGDLSKIGNVNTLINDFLVAM